MNSYLSQELLNKGTEACNSKYYFFALVNNAEEKDILSVSEVFNSPFTTCDNKLTIKGYEGECKKIKDGTAGCLALFETTSESGYPYTEGNKIIFYNSLKNKIEVNESNYCFFLGNINIKFEGIEC